MIQSKYSRSLVSMLDFSCFYWSSLLGCNLHSLFVPVLSLIIVGGLIAAAVTFILYAFHSNGASQTTGLCMIYDTAMLSVTGRPQEPPPAPMTPNVYEFAGVYVLPFISSYNSTSDPTKFLVAGDAALGSMIRWTPAGDSASVSLVGSLTLSFGVTRTQATARMNVAVAWTTDYETPTSGSQILANVQLDMLLINNTAYEVVTIPFSLTLARASLDINGMIAIIGLIRTTNTGVTLNPRALTIQVTERSTVIC